MDQICPECRTSIDAENTYCPACGHNLKTHKKSNVANSGPGLSELIHQDIEIRIRILFYTWPFNGTLLLESFVLFFFPGLMDPILERALGIWIVVFIGLPISINVLYLLALGSDD